MLYPFSRPLILLLFAALLGLTGCGPTPLFERTDDLPTEGWAYADTLVYPFSVSDTTARYDLQVLVGHTTDFPYQNFYVEVDTYLPDGRRLRQPLSLQLADKFGRWYGDCGGQDCLSTITIQNGLRFRPAGDYRVVLRQHSREPVLAGLGSMGLRLVPEEGGQ